MKYLVSAPHKWDGMDSGNTDIPITTLLSAEAKLNEVRSVNLFYIFRNMIFMENSAVPIYTLYVIPLQIA